MGYNKYKHSKDPLRLPSTQRGVGPAETEFKLSSKYWELAEKGKAHVHAAKAGTGCLRSMLE
jgi:hypothetical protein